MKPAQQAREDYIAWCLAQLKEAPWEVPAGSNRNDYSKDLGYAPDAWCVDFGQAGLHATGSGGGIIPTRSTLAHINWAKTVGRHRSRTSPARGALAAVAKNGTSVHTDACVINASTKRLVAIGGNTSNRGGSTADGGGVYANDRTYMLGDGTYRIYGFTVPFFGITVQDALDIQGALGVKRTGYITPATVAAVRRFQASKGLTADGYPGPATYAALGGTASPTITATAADQEEAELMAAKDDIIQALSAKIDAIPKQVWGVEGGANAPMIPKGEGTGTEYPGTALAEVVRRANRAIPSSVWRGEQVGRRLEGGSEYAETTLGSLTDRIVRQQIIPLRGEVAGLRAALEQLAKGQGIDMDAITAAAEKGAREGAAAVSAEDVAAKLTVQTKP